MASVPIASVSAEPAGSVSLEALESVVPATAATAAVAVSPSPVNPPSDESLDEVQLDAAKLHCYQLALELHTLCSTLVASLNRIVRDQLERASLSVVLNTAEAGGRHSRREKARYYAIARGSATEVAALMDVLERRHLAPMSANRCGRRLAIRVVQMLTRMNQKLLP